MSTPYILTDYGWLTPREYDALRAGKPIADVIREADAAEEQIRAAAIAQATERAERERREREGEDPDGVRTVSGE